jgi:D-glycero-D-manno-heptose 1,7-bisphosphate phosphatase
MRRRANRAVFLDRDGVLSRIYIHEDGKSHPPASPEEIEILPGVPEACLDLRAAGFLLIAVTNQPDVARGTQRREVVEDINARLRQRIALDEIMVCYHDNADKCSCRKPKPGLLLKAADIWGIDLRASFMVGDRWTDIEAGYGAGCRTVLISSLPLEPGYRKPDFHGGSLADAAEWILQGKIKDGKMRAHHALSPTEFLGRNK